MSLPCPTQVLRAFRVLRLFGRLESLRNIVTAITASIIPVLNAFVIIYLVASICSIYPFDIHANISHLTPSFEYVSTSLIYPGIIAHTDTFKK